MADYVAFLHLQPPLQPREAFFGGRTDVVQLNRTTAQREEIPYYDYTSLYPWVNKNARYPVGHTELIYAPDTVEHHPYFGLAKCTVLPPLGLYHPVLPYRKGDKLTFPLCRNCVENQLDQPLKAKSWQYPQTNKQRAQTSTWCTSELDKTVEQRYVVLNPRIIPLWPTTTTFAPIQPLLPESNLFARIQPFLPEYNNFCPNTATFARIQPLCPNTTTFARIQPLCPNTTTFTRLQTLLPKTTTLPDYIHFCPNTTTFAR